MAKSEDQERSLSAVTPRTDEAKADLKEQEKELGERPAPETGEKQSDELDPGAHKYPVPEAAGGPRAEQPEQE